MALVTWICVAAIAVAGWRMWRSTGAVSRWGHAWRIGVAIVLIGLASM